MLCDLRAEPDSVKRIDPSDLAALLAIARHRSFRAAAVELGVSASALLKNLECRAAAFGAERLFGDTLRSNDAMLGLARKSGFAFTNSPGDWKLVRFEKHIDSAPQESPCASWRLAAQQTALHAAV